MSNRNEYLDHLLFPDDEEQTFLLDMKWHMARVRAAVRFLDEANMARLKRAATLQAVTKTNAVWQKAVTRMRQS
jgi:hypothetical protein